MIFAGFGFFIFPPIGAIIVLVAIGMTIKIHKHNNRMKLAQWAIDNNLQGQGEKNIKKQYKEYKKGLK